MGRNGVKVIIRTRPTASFATSQIQIDTDENTVTVFSNGQLSGSPTKRDGSDNWSPGRDPSAASTAMPISAVPSNRKDCWRFRFHQVLHNSSQDKVYEAIARDIVHGAVVDGVNGTILAYGQTGAGKSFTMIGDTRNYQHRGIAPRAVAQVYEELENRIEIAYTIKVSYMEIYNDRIYDLLENNTAIQAALNGTSSGDLVVVEDARGTSVRGLTQVEASSEQDALDQLFNGELQRTVAEHQLNKRSNRSHCIFTLHISQKSRAGGNEKVTHSKLHLVDLAGSERLKKTVDDPTTTGTTTIKKESMYINQSLSFLEQCIVALSAKEQRHIPYRQTKLTNVLKDSLGGNSNTLMFACIWGESKHLEETISTLKLAQRMMKVTNQVASIVETDPAILLRKYEKQIKELRHELVMHDALVERTGVVYDDHTPEQKHQLMQVVRQYVDATTRDQEDALLKLSSVHEIRELFRQFKVLFKNVESEAQQAGSGGGAGGPLRGHSAGSNGSRTQSSTGSRADIHGGGGGGGGSGGGGGGGSGGERGLHGLHGEDLVGEDDPHSTGFGLGVASSAARPSTIDAQRKAKAAGGRGGENHDGGRSRHRSPSPTRSPPKGDDKATRQHFSGGPVGDNNHDRHDGGGEGGGGEEHNSEDTRFKNDAFQFYKSTGPGKKIYQSLQEEKDKLGDCKHNLKSISSRVNAVMLQIDDAKHKLQEKRAQRPPGSLAMSPTKKASSSSSGAKVSSEEVVVDEEEFILMKAEREAKRDYRSLFEDLKEARAELSFTTRSVELLRMRLVREFEDWFEEEGIHLAAAAKSEDDDERGYRGGGGGGDGGRGGVSGFHAMLFASKEDKLDDGEKFDQMEVDRVRAQDPDSLAFFQAQKKMRHQAAMGGGAAAQSKSLRKSKRGV